MRDPSRRESGQALVLLVGALLAVVVGAILLGGVARGLGAGADRQTAADLAALAGARAMHRDYGRLFEASSIGGRFNRRHLGRLSMSRAPVRRRGGSARLPARAR